MLTGTHKLKNYIIYHDILCWLGLTISSLLYLDLDSHHWLLYFLKIYSMLTGTHNLIITLCSMGLTSLIMLFFETTIYVEWDSKLIITSCWLGLTSLIMIFKKNIFYVDRDSQQHHCFITSLIMIYSRNIFYVDWESKTGKLYSM